MSITDEFIPFCLIVFYNCVEQPFIALNNKFFHLMFFVGIKLYISIQHRITPGD